MTEGQNENGGLRAGMEMRKDYVVSRDQTARVVGSGGLEVLATPVLSAWIENVAYEMVDLWLKDDQTTVGGSITTAHIAPTPVGLKVRVNVRLEKIDGRKLIFSTEAWDTVQKIAEGEHVRFIVDKKRFMDKVAKKKEN